MKVILEFNPLALSLRYIIKLILRAYAKMKITLKRFVATSNYLITSHYIFILSPMITLIYQNIISPIPTIFSLKQNYFN